jgi:hypothetical protein
MKKESSSTTNQFLAVHVDDLREEMCLQHIALHPSIRSH